jgi:drug/metabolite transporter (DMT)-like permease
MPMAEAIAIFFVEPLILTLLSGPLLGERVGWRRYLACVVGFGGAMLIIRPSFAEFGWLAAAPLAAALCFALYLALTRRHALRLDPVSMQLWSGVAGAAVIGALLLVGHAMGSTFFRVAPVGTETLWMMLGVGAFATVSHFFIAAAFARAPASVLAPFQYLEIITAVLAGYLAFGDFPDAVTWAGIAIIVGSGLVIFHRERVASRRAATGG